MEHVPHVSSAGSNACGQKTRRLDCNQGVLDEAGTKPEPLWLWFRERRIWSLSTQIGLRGNNKESSSALLIASRYLLFLSYVQEVSRHA